jgi:hypothetical protein
MESKIVLILAENPRDAGLYANLLDDRDADCGFLTVTTVQQAMAFCGEMMPDCLVVDDSVNVPEFLTALAGAGGILPCAVITIVRPEAAAIDPLMTEERMADR